MQKSCPHLFCIFKYLNIDYHFVRLEYNIYANHLVHGLNDQKTHRIITLEWSSMPYITIMPRIQVLIRCIRVRVPFYSHNLILVTKTFASDIYFVIQAFYK